MSRLFRATGYNEFADAQCKQDVILGKEYPVLHDYQSDKDFFVDEAGDKNYGCNDENDTVYVFDIIEVEQ